MLWYGPNDIIPTLFAKIPTSKFLVLESTNSVSFWASAGVLRLVKSYAMTTV